MPTLVTAASVCAVLLSGNWAVVWLWGAGVAAPETDRAGFRSAAIAYTFVTGSAILLLLGLPDDIFWFVARPLVMVAFMVTWVLAPKVRGMHRSWLDVMITGWMAAGSMALLVWLALTVQPWAHRLPEIGWPGVWLVVNGLWLRALSGLLTRAAPCHRSVLRLLVIATFASFVGDLVAILLGHAAYGIPCWVGSGLFTAAAARRGVVDVFHGLDLRGDAPAALQWYLLPFAPAVVYLLIPGERDCFSRIIAGSLVAALMIKVIIDGRQNRRLWKELSNRTHRYRKVLADSRDVILEVDRGGVITFASPASAEVLGFQPGDLLGTTLAQRIHPDDFAQNNDAARVVMSGGAPVPAQVQASRFRVADREWRAIEWTVNWRASDECLVLSGRDISERARLAAELQQQARVDSLTGLLNRGAFLNDVGDRLASGETAILMMVDLDHFKAVNDTLGHAEGDTLLRDIGHRLQSAIPTSAIAARLGGDEFAVMTLGECVREAEQLASLIIASIVAHEQHHRDRPRISASIGIAKGRGLSAAELLRNADLAMYRAKGDGRSTSVVFEPWMSERVIEESRLYGELESAIESNRLAIHLQPVVRLADGGWHKFEALVRWQDGENLRPPSDFLPLAEVSGLIVPLGTWVLGEALRQLATWPDSSVGIAVNVSPRQLEDPLFGEIVQRALTEAGVPPERLTLEITEQTAVADLNGTASQLARLQNSGVHIAVDDFGTGFSSMRYLTRLPINTLKIDQQFVAGIGAREEDEILVLSIIRLATDLGLLIVAEGVETHAQAEFLLRHGCPLGQGYYFSAPREISELRVMEAERQSVATDNAKAVVVE